MKLHLRADGITISITENSSHYVHVKQTLANAFGHSFWINDTLINFTTHYDSTKRRAFLASLYVKCAFLSKSHNLSFLHKLLLASHLPIRLVIKQLRSQKETDPYRLLNAHPHEKLSTIRHKYLKLAKKFHPDLANDSNPQEIETRTRLFQQIQEAYHEIKSKSLAA